VSGEELRNVEIKRPTLHLALHCAGGVSGSDAVVRQAIDAVGSDDDDAIIASFSSGTVESISAQVKGFKVNPEGNLGYLAMMGIEVSVEDVQNMDAGDFITWMLQSDFMKALFSDFSAMEIVESVIDSEHAVVSIVLEGFVVDGR